MTDKNEAAPQDAEQDLTQALDIARGELNMDDLSNLEAAIDVIDFATRKAAPEVQTRLQALIERMNDVGEQIKQGVRKPRPDRGPLSAEEEERYNTLASEGLAAGEQGNLAEAMDKLEQAVLIDPDGEGAVFNLGVVYGLMAHMNVARAEFYDNYVRDEVYVEKAKRCYDRILELVPDHMASLNNLATLYSMRDERDLAAPLLRRMLEIEPQDDAQKKLVEGARKQLEELESV